VRRQAVWLGHREDPQPRQHLGVDLVDPGPQQALLVAEMVVERRASGPPRR